MNLSQPRKTIFAISADSLKEFEEAARISASCGATHLVVTEDLPVAHWQFDTPGDPYPAWFAFQPGLLKTYPPTALRSFMDADHPARVQEVLRQRCAILARHGLRGVYHSTEPQVLPEAVFEAHPAWRGPRVDQPNRSRVARFAPCVAHPEVHPLYAESVRHLLTDLPEIDTFLFFTIDSGSGFCWAPALYPGPNGCCRCSEADVGDRATGFLRLLADSAREEGRSVEIDLVEIEPRSWMRKAFARPAELARQLSPGLSINHHEGPDGRRFVSRRFGNLFYNAFYPVIGLPRPVDFVRKLAADHRLDAPRWVCSFNDGLNNKLNAAVFSTFQENPTEIELDCLLLLRRVAASLHHPSHADTVVGIWMALDDAERQLASLDFGPFLLMGGLLSRWITRPFVPFPEELSDAETNTFRPFLFQARDEESARNLVDIQAMRMFEGWGARLIVQQTIETTLAHLYRAAVLGRSLPAGGLPDLDSAALLLRIDLLACLLENGGNAVAYQAQLDRAKASAGEFDVSQPPPPLGAPTPWELHDLATIARTEIDNTARILELLDTAHANRTPVLDMAPEDHPESIMRLGSNLPDHLQQKLKTMNSKWTDYARLAPPANP